MNKSLVFFQDIMLFFAGMMIILLSLVYSNKGREEIREDNSYFLVRTEISAAEWSPVPSGFFEVNDKETIIGVFRESGSQFLVVVYKARQDIRDGVKTVSDGNRTKEVTVTIKKMAFAGFSIDNATVVGEADTRTKPSGPLNGAEDLKNYLIQHQGITNGYEVKYVLEE